MEKCGLRTLTIACQTQQCCVLLSEIFEKSWTCGIVNNMDEVVEFTVFTVCRLHLLSEFSCFKIILKSLKLSGKCVE